MSSLESIAGPSTIIDKSNSDKGMPSVGDTVLYQREPVNGLAFSRPLIVTSVESRRQLISGWILPDARLDSQPTGMTFRADISFGTPGQPDTWHWPVRGYTGRADAPQEIPAVEPNVVDVGEQGNAGTTQPLAPPSNVEPQPEFNPADRNRDGEVSAKEQKLYDKQHPQD